MGLGTGLSNSLRPDISERDNTATECREAHGVRGACSRFGARWVARKRQQAGRTPHASRGSSAERQSRSELLLKAQCLFALPLAPGLPLQPLDGSPLTRVGEFVESSQGNGMRASRRSSSVPSDKRTTRKRQFLRKAPTQQRVVQRQTSSTSSPEDSI